jgi:hypothetical protein
MLWSILGLIGGGSFIVSGFSVLTDPTCHSVDFGGGRVIQMTCRGDLGGTLSNVAAGWLSICGGLLLLGFIFRTPIKKALIGFWNPKPISSDSFFSDQTNPSPSEQSSPKEALFDSDEFPKSDAQKRCPKCAELVLAEAIKCRFCGSSLLPSFEDKFREKLRNKNFKMGMAAVVVLTLILGGFLAHSINLSKQRRLLNASGQVCVYLVNNQTSLGCADYPKVDFSFCSTAVSMEIEYAKSNYESIFDFEGTQPKRFDGNIINSCNKGYPYSYQVYTLTNRTLGEYDLVDWDFTVPASQSGDLTSGGGFVMKISLK